MARDTEAAATRLKWKPSRNGGRTIATPSSTTSALGATRRRGGRPPSALDHLTEVIVKGDIGRQDGEVIGLLMDHLNAKTGLGVKAAGDIRNPKTGEYVYQAAVDTGAPAGKVKLLLSDGDSVRRVFATLHGQTLQVGTDHIAIEVSNDLVNAAAASGNDLRGRA